MTIFFKDVRQQQIDRIESSTIQWKEGIDLTKETVQKKQRNKKTGTQRTISKVVDADTIFTCFQTFKPIDWEVVGEDHDMTEEE